MVANYHGHVWNAAEFARAIGTGQATARRHLDILSDARMVRILPPWHENLKKRQVKSPKIYVRDAGVLHSLIELESIGALGGHPKVGASFEGFGIEQIPNRPDRVGELIRSRAGRSRESNVLAARSVRPR